MTTFSTANNNSKLARSIAILTGLATVTLVTPLQAQEAPTSTSESEKLEEVVVTGSNIRTTGFDALVPLQVQTRVDFENSGVANFSDVFRNIPGNSGSEAFTEASPRAGQSQFNLRGLGSSSTLTLINGRRAGVSPLDDAGTEYTDINQFPLAMVERVEVLKDGASAIYGSDAVAGVVNIITRKGYEGVEVSGGYQQATNHSYFANLATGKKFEGGSFNLYATYYSQTGNNRTDFDWLVKRIGGNGLPGRSQLLTGNAQPSSYFAGGLNAAGRPIALASAVGFADPDCEAAGGVFRIRDDGTLDRSSCLHDFADQVAIIPDAERLQVFTEFTMRLTEGITFSGEASFSRNVLETTRGPGGFTNGNVVGSSVGSVYIPGSHPFNFFQRDPANPARLVYVPPSQWNPAVNQAVDVVASIRPLGAAFNGDNAPKRRSQTDSPRFVGILDFELPRAWAAKASYQYAAANFTDTQPLRYRADMLTQLIASGSFNPFGTAVTNPTLVSPKDGSSVAANSDEVLRQFLTNSTDTARTEQHVVDIVASGDAFTLGERDVGLAVGAQFRSLSLDIVPDALQAAGRGDTNSLQSAQSNDHDVIGAFAELAIPIGAHATTQLAARYEDYGRYGTTVNPKVAGTVEIGERVSLRGSWGTSFQGPTLFQTSTSTGRSFLNDQVELVGDTFVCRGRTVASTNVAVNVKGDPNLEPQHSTNYNLGVVFEPLDRAQVSVDYWNYRYKDLIAAAAEPQAIIDNDCKADGVPNDPRIIREASGLVEQINTTYVNVGRVETDGVDLAGALTWRLEPLGEISLTLDATWLRKFDVIGGEGGAFDGAGSRNFANNFRTMPRWRAVSGLSWTRGAQSAGLKVRYISGYRNDQSNNAEVDDYMPVDLSYGYTLSGLGDSSSTVVFGADNLFDVDPPALVRNDASGNRITSERYQYIDRPGYDAYSGADLRGRVLWVRFVHELR